MASKDTATLEKSLRPLRGAKELDPSKYTTRIIALKFAYLGRKYNGLEYASGNITAQPTIEEVLWKALRKAKLIFPSDEEAIATGEISWAGCDYTKCGRTDKGVSAFGQVIGLRVRSHRPLSSKQKDETTGSKQDSFDSERKTSLYGSDDVEPVFDPVMDELPYGQILNNILPSDIRVLAWCSDLPQDFSARFSCRERRYRYFFTNPAFAPTIASGDPAADEMVNAPGETLRRENHLDIQAMQDAAKRYEGLHDFRNLCKIDPSKQLTDFRRRIFHSEIRELDPSKEPAAYATGQAFSELGALANGNGTTHGEMSVPPKVFEFVLHGSAFLYHQVRHMVAILFLVGQGLETPDIVNKLLDTKNCPQKPWYDMADDAPLVLWDCIFPDLDGKDGHDSLKWIYAGQESGTECRALKNKYALIDSLWKTWHKHKIDEVLAGSLLNLAASQGNLEWVSTPREAERPRLSLGGDSGVYQGAYIQLMQRPRGEHFEVQNARYAAKKGFTPKSEEELQQLRSTRRDKRHDHLEEDYVR